jgi:hypothetical protein
MEVRTKQVIYGVAEVIAAHNLLRYVRKNNDEERLRMATGAGLAGLGFAFGPELQDRLQHLGDRELTAATKERLLYAAGGALLGGIIGNKVGPHLPLSIEEAINNATEEMLAHPQQPGALVTLASAGWLGYSLFFDGKTPEEQKRHLWGLGAGVVGFMYGPELLRKVSNMTVPAHAADEAVQVYASGSAVIGTVAGGLLGWYKGDAFMQKLRGAHGKAD